MHNLARSSDYVDVCAYLSSSVKTDMQISTDFLRRIRPKSIYNLSGNIFDNNVRKIIKLIQEIKSSSPLIDKRQRLLRCSTDIVYCCNILFEQFFSEIRNWLFLLYIYKKSERQDYFIFFDVKKNMFYRFFEALRIENTDCKYCSPVKIEKDSTKTPITVLNVKLQAIRSTLQTLADSVALDSELSCWADYLSQDKAFYSFTNYSRQSLVGRVVIINRATDRLYTLKTYNRNNKIDIINYVTRPENRTYVSHVVDSKNTRRTKIITLQDFIERRDPCILRVLYNCNVLLEIDDVASHSVCQ